MWETARIARQIGGGATPLAKGFQGSAVIAPTISTSVVIPTFNSANTIERAIGSCRRQSFAPSEIIVVDDASTDATPGLMACLKREDSRIRYLRLPRREGAQKARLTGIVESRSDWIVFLDADDELLPDSILRRTEILSDSDDETALVYGDTYFEAPGENFFRFKELYGLSYQWLCKELSLCPYSCMMVRRAAFGRAGYPDPHFPSWQDDDMVLTIGKIFPVRHCGAPVAIMHRVSNSITSSQRRIAEGCRLMVRKYTRDIVEHHGYFRLFLWNIRIARAYLLAFCGDDLAVHHKYVQKKGLCPQIVARSQVLYRGAIRRLAQGLTKYLSRHFDHIYA